MTSTLMDKVTTSRVARISDQLDRSGVAAVEWLSQQYVARVITAMTHDLFDDDRVARRYATLRLIEVIMEHRHNLVPSEPEDFSNPRARILPLAVGERFLECEPWLDILEYMQLLNWRRKQTHWNVAREQQLVRCIADNFSYALVHEIRAETDEWWIT